MGAADLGPGRGADLGLRLCPLSNVGLEALGWVVEKEAHAECREALVCVLVHVGPVVQQKADDVVVTVNLEGGSQPHEDSR